MFRELRAKLETARGANVRLDWKAYYERFRDAHGEPVVLDGRQLFQDGWSYSLQSYRGPEFPPPENPEELRLLKRSYWKRRRAVALEGKERLAVALEALTEAQAQRNQPLQHAVAYTSMDADGNRFLKRETRDLDLNDLRRAIEDRDHLISRCNDMLKELSHASAQTA